LVILHFALIGGYTKCFYRVDYVDMDMFMESGYWYGWISIVLLLYVFGIKYLNVILQLPVQLICYACVPRGKY